MLADPADAFLEAVSSDGLQAAFTSTQKLTDDASEDSAPGDSAHAKSCRRTAGANGCNLYLADLSQGSPALTDISSGDISGEGPQVQGVMAISPDGSHVYFVARGVLTSGANHDGSAPVEGADNLYVYERDEAHPAGRTAFVATLPASNLGTRAETREWGENALANVTPSGDVLVFTSRGALTADTHAEGAAQVFRYDAPSETLQRISFGAQGFNDNGNAAEGEALMAIPGAIIGPGRADPTMADDGSEIFFESSVGLTPVALNDVSVNGNPEAFAQNVYEWEADGKGACAAAGGCVYLISDGLDDSESNGGDANSTLSSVELLGTDTRGENVFFTTADPLVPLDTDSQLDYYDARVGGGFAAPAAPAGCAAEESCPGPATTPPPPEQLASTLAPALGNLIAPPSIFPPKPPPPKPTSRAQRLAAALRACRAKHGRHVRVACERAARKRYAAGHETRKRGKGARRGKGDKRGRAKPGARPAGSGR